MCPGHVVLTSMKLLRERCLHRALVLTLGPQHLQVTSSLQKAGAAPDPAFGCGSAGEVACSHVEVSYICSHYF